MLKVGITGGIGCGKSTVCGIFKALGVPVINADDIAKLIMNTDFRVSGEIKSIFGEEAYKQGKLDNAHIAAIVFKEPDKLSLLNAIVHPATTQYIRAWQDSQNSVYTIKEAAIFFETGLDKEMDRMIGVSAPEPLRIERVMKRSGLTYEEVKLRIDRQMNEKEKMTRCNYNIINDDKTALIPQVLQLHQLLMAV